MWWPNHIIPAHVLRVAKNIACCVWKTSQDCISVYMLWRLEIWENHFNSHTIITVWWRLSPSRYILQLPHLLEDTLATIYKAFLFFLLLFSLHIFYLKQIIHGHIRERKEISNDVKLFDIALLLCRSIHISLTLHFCYAEAYRCHFMIGGQQWWDGYLCLSLRIF